MYIHIHIYTYSFFSVPWHVEVACVLRTMSLHPRASVAANHLCTDPSMHTMEQILGQDFAAKRSELQSLVYIYIYIYMHIYIYIYIFVDL